MLTSSLHILTSDRLMKKKVFMSCVPFLLIGAFFFRPVLNVEALLDLPQPEIEGDVSSNAEKLHKEIRVADLHADSLLWSRNLADRSEIGHLDVPRMLQGNFALQLFMAVVESPNNVVGDHLEERGDLILPIAVADKWPVRTWRSHFARAEFIAKRLRILESNSNGLLTIVESRQDLDRFLRSHKEDSYQVAAILGTEGAHATEWNLENLEQLFDMGYRSLSLAHYTDTPYVGSSSGMQQNGLTEKGELAVKEMERLGMPIDLAHVSEEGIRDILELTKRPAYASHVGVRATCMADRNLSDRAIEMIADQRGIIGIGFFEDGICSKSIEGVVDAIEHIKNLVGSEYAALGSGFDISPMPIDVSQMVFLTDALLNRGFSEEEVANVMGENVIRYFLTALPDETKP